MSDFRFRQWRVWYEAVGAGEPIVFLHNGGNDHRVWDRQVERFSRSHRVYVLDHLGFGRSEKPTIEYTLPLYIDQVEAFMEEIDAPATIVGHCIGGAMALGYALRRPERVRRLALFNVATEQTLCAGPLRPFYERFSRDRAALETFLEPIERRGLPPERVREALSLQYAPGGAPEPEFAAYIGELYNQPGQMRSMYNSFANWATWGMIDDVAKPPGFPPTLLIWGEANQVLPCAAGLAFAARLRPDRTVVLADAGHLAMREQPDEVNALLESFFAGQRPC